MDALYKIMSLLKENNIEQQEFANAIGVRKQAISEWKKGTTKSYMKYIDKIAEFFGVSTDYLLKSEEPQISGWLEQSIYKLSKELNQPRERLIGFFMDYTQKISDLALYEERFHADEDELRTIFKNYLEPEKAVHIELPLSEKQETVLRLSEQLTDEDLKKLIDYAELLRKAKNQ